MRITEFGLKNFKSFGNNETTIKLNPTIGELILLVGRNGHGKSSLIESLDYTAYKKVKGKYKKTQTLSTLPNRINKEMLTWMKFISDNNDNIEIRRGMHPNTLDLLINDTDFDRAGNSNIDAKIEKIIGMDFETYKSFLSMSINDFKNFINLKPEEKRLLLDKLFNLEILNELNEILKTMDSTNKKQIDIYSKEISTFEESIRSLNTSIVRTQEKLKLSLSSEIDEIKNFITENKITYDALKDKIAKIEDKKKEIETQLDDYKTSYTTTQSNIKETDSKINLYDSGKCPTCESDLKTALSLQVRESYISQKVKLEEIRETLKIDIQKLMTSNEKIKNIYKEATDKFNTIRYELNQKKSRYDQLILQENSKNGINPEIIDEFSKSLIEFESKKEIAKSNQEEALDMRLIHKELSKVFSEDGVKKMIIRNIVDPINHFISHNLDKMNMDFQVSLDEDFSATILDKGDEIDPESMSTGETRKVNLAVMVAYLKMIRTKKMVNVLFLDEVFSSIDFESVDDILVMMKDFAKEYQINIFLVHHSNLDTNLFDRILRIKKDFFTNIEEEVIVQ